MLFFFFWGVIVFFFFKFYFIFKLYITVLVLTNNEMSANLEKENELLRTTYAKCIEEEIDNLRNMTCGTCERLKSENEVLRTRCKSLCAKGLDSRISCHSDVDAFTIAS